MLTYFFTTVSWFFYLFSWPCFRLRSNSLLRRAYVRLLFRNIKTLVSANLRKPTYLLVMSSLFRLHRKNSVNLQKYNSVVAWYLAALVAPLGVYGVALGYNEVIIDINPAQVHVAAVLFAKHTAIRANTLIDLIVYDRPGFHSRFTVIYVLLSHSFQTRIRLRTAISAARTLVTICFIFSNAN